MKQINVRTYGIFPEDCRENTWRLRTMLEKFRTEEGLQIVFESGTYHFYPDYAIEKLLYISNHDEDTMKRIAFDLSEFRHLVIRGEETQFVFHTDVIPFYLHACEEVKIEGITIDYARPGYSEGKIRELEPQRMVVEIDPAKYPYEIFNGRLYFRGENFFNEMTHGCLEMDGERHAPVCQGHDIGFNRPYPWSYGAVFTELEPGVVEIRLMGDKEFLKTSKVGNDLIFRHHARTHPAFYVTYSKDIVLQDMVVYHCVGMAVIAQFSENLTIRRFDVRRHPEKKRIFTATADGFHLIYCRGRIQIQYCLLENQLDDPLNIHGIYGRIHKIISEREALIELVEGMQKGVLLGKKGEHFRIIDNETMMEVASASLEEYQMLNGDYQYMKFEHPISEWKENFVVENIDYVPDVLVEGCTFRNNRARGLLLTSAGDVLVRKNVFQTAGAAILIEGDSNYWFESGATRHIVIEQNQFIDCAYVPDWGNAPIQVSPSAKTYVEGQRYHKYLELRDNEFYCFDDRILWAQNIEEIRMTGNRIYRTETFPPIAGERFCLHGILKFQEE